MNVLNLKTGEPFDPLPRLHHRTETSLAVSSSEHSQRARGMLLAAKSFYIGGKSKPSTSDYPIAKMMAFWDGIDNGGVGVHNSAPQTITDISGNGHDMTIVSNHLAITENSFVTDGVAVGAWCGDALTITTTPVAYEYVVKFGGSNGILFANANAANKAFVSGANSCGTLSYTDGYVCLNAWRTAICDTSHIYQIGLYTNKSYYADDGNGKYSCNGDALPYQLVNKGNPNGGWAWCFGGRARSDLTDRIFSQLACSGNIYSIRLYKELPTAEERAKILEFDKARFGI